MVFEGTTTGRLLAVTNKLGPKEGTKEIAHAAYVTLRINRSLEDPYRTERITDNQRAIFREYGKLYLLNGATEGICLALENMVGDLNHDAMKAWNARNNRVLPENIFYHPDYRMTSKDADGLMHNLVDVVKDGFSQYEADAIMACLRVELDPDKEEKLNIFRVRCEEHLIRLTGYKPGVYIPRPT